MNRVFEVANCVDCPHKKDGGNWSSYEPTCGKTGNKLPGKIRIHWMIAVTHVDPGIPDWCPLPLVPTLEEKL